jgi:DNA-binding NtrC family response regulator
MSWIKTYHWPGNVRQLRAMCERWVIVAQGRTVLREMLPTEMVSPGLAPTSDHSLEVDVEQPLAPQLERMQVQLERSYLHKVLLHCGGHLQKSAAHAGISRRTLYNKMKAYGMDPSAYRSPA